MEVECARLSFPSPGVSLGSPSTTTWNLVEKKNPLAFPDSLPPGDSQETPKSRGWEVCEEISSMEGTDHQ